MSHPLIDLVVQISDKRGRYIERAKLGADGLTIGRAWNSDIIIQDKYVDADQLKMTLSDQGRTDLQDLGSTNGSLLANKPLYKVARAYRWGEEIRIGDTILRIFDAASGVTKTANRSTWYSLLEPFKTKRSLILVGLIAALFSTLNIWLFSTEPFAAIDFFARFASASIFLFFWTLVFGSISKLVRGQSNMRAHWILVCMATIVILVLSFVVSVARFNIQSPDVGQWVSSLAYGGLSVALVFALLTYSSHLGNRAKWFWSLLLVGGTVANVYSDSFLKQEHELWNGVAKAEQATLPPALMFRKPVSLDDYFDDTQQLFDQTSNQTGEKE